MNAITSAPYRILSIPLITGTVDGILMRSYEGARPLAALASHCDAGSMAQCISPFELWTS